MSRVYTGTKTLHPGTVGLGTVGDVDWVATGTFVSDLASSDDVWTTLAFSAGGQSSNALRCTGFNFSIPLSATVLGIQVSVERWQNTTIGGGIQDYRYKLLKADGTNGTENKAGGVWPSTEAVATYGGSTDLWSEDAYFSQAWVINHPDFGVNLRVNNGAAIARNGGIDEVYMQIWYEIMGKGVFMAASGGTHVSGYQRAIGRKPMINVDTLGH